MAKWRAEQTSLISMESSSGCGQILHGGHKIREHLGTGMGWGAASRATCVAPTFPHHQPPAVGSCPTRDGSCRCSLHPDFTAASQQSKNGGKKKEILTRTRNLMAEMVKRGMALGDNRCHAVAGVNPRSRVWPFTP